QFAEFNSGVAGDDVGTRDGYMAENFLDAAAREKQDTRFVVWAHNAHICKRDAGGFHALGSYLRKAFGDKYYALGCAFDSGSFRAQLPRVQPPKVEVFHLDSSAAGTIDWYMSQVGLANYLVDLKAKANDPQVAEWLKASHNLHWVGAFFSAKPGESSSVRPFVLSRDFDGLLFLSKGTPTRPSRS